MWKVAVLTLFRLKDGVIEDKCTHKFTDLHLYGCKRLIPLQRYSKMLFKPTINVACKGDGSLCIQQQLKGLETKEEQASDASGFQMD